MLVNQFYELRTISIIRIILSCISYILGNRKSIKYALKGKPDISESDEFIPDKHKPIHYSSQKGC